MAQKKNEADDKTKTNDLSAPELVALLVREPQRADELDELDWLKLGGTEWALVLFARPELADRCRWETFGGESNYYWNRVFLPDGCAELLFPPPPEVDGKVWNRLLETSIDNKTGKLRPWPALLAERPEFASHCECWDDFSSADWERLLSAQPQFADKRK